MAVSDHSAIFDAAGKEWNVDPTLLRAVATQESSGNPRLVSRAGAQGLMQIMPRTAQGLGVTDPFDPVQSIYGGAKYLSQMLDRYPTPQLALAAYNAGPDRVDAARAGRGQLPQETLAYVPAVTAHYGKLIAANATPATPAPARAAAASGPESVDDFLKRTAGTPPAPQPAAAKAETADDFLKRTGGAAAPPAASASPDEIQGPATEEAYGQMVAQGLPTRAAPSAPPPPPQSTVPLAGLPVPGYPGQVSKGAPAPAAAAAAAPAAPQFNAQVDDYGRPIPGTAPVAAPSVPAPVQHVASAVGSAFQGPYGPSDATMGALVSGPSPTMNLVNRLIVGGGGTILDAAGRPLMALARGAGALASEGYQALGGSSGMGSRLERDIAQAPEALLPLTAPGASGVPRVAEAPAASPYPAIANKLQAAIESDVQGPGRGQYLLNKLTGAIQQVDALPEARQGAPVAAAEAANVSDAARAAAGGAAGQQGSEAPQPVAGAPRSVGAAASSAEQSNMAPKETAAYQAMAEGDKLREAQPPGKDLNAYIPGIEPTLAQTEQSVNTSRELKALNTTAPGVSAEAKAIAAEHNDLRKNYFNDMSGSEVDVMNAKAARAAQAERDLAGVWKNKTEANPQPVLDAAADVLASPDGRRPLVRKALDGVTKELYGADGKTLITDPEQLYGVRKHIDDMMSKEAGAADPQSVRVMANLQSLKEALDGVITPAANGFDTYLKNYADASRPIDAMEVLQAHANKLHDTQGRMQLSRVQTMMRNIVESRSAPGVNQYKSIPDETMTKLWALRDDLRRAASAEELARTAGSDSIQNGWDVTKGLARLGSEGAAHVGANLAFPVVGSFGVQAVKNALAPVLAERAAKKQTQRGMEILRPNRLQTPLRDPNAGP